MVRFVSLCYKGKDGYDPKSASCDRDVSNFQRASKLNSKLDIANSISICFFFFFFLQVYVIVGHNAWNYPGDWR
jgi:hypothetical protein